MVMFKKLWQDFLRAMRAAIWRITRAGLLGVVIGALAVEIAAYMVDGRWPPHLAAHVAAGAFALLLGYAAAITVVVIEGARGLAAAVSQLDDVARATAETGLNVLDAMVDAVDGPDRHGFLGRRNPAIPPIPASTSVASAPVVAYPRVDPPVYDPSARASQPRSYPPSYPPIYPQSDPQSHPTWPGLAHLRTGSLR